MKPKALIIAFIAAILSGCGGPSEQPQGVTEVRSARQKAPDESAALAAIAAVNEAQKTYMGRNRRYALTAGGGCALIRTPGRPRGPETFWPGFLNAMGIRLEELSFQGTP